MNVKREALLLQLHFHCLSYIHFFCSILFHHTDMSSNQKAITKNLTWGRKAMVQCMMGNRWSIFQILWKNMSPLVLVSGKSCFSSTTNNSWNAVAMREQFIKNLTTSQGHECKLVIHFVPGTSPRQSGSIRKWRRSLNHKEVNEVDSLVGNEDDEENRDGNLFIHF